MLGKRALLSLIILFFFAIPISSQAQNDGNWESEPVTVRTFDEEKRKVLLDDPAYLYGRDKIEANKNQRDNAGAQNRANKGLWDFLFRDRAIGFNVAEILLYIMGILGILFFILTFLKVDVRGVFSKKAKQIPVNFEDLGENLAELDFEGLIRQARTKGDYRAAVRLVFLETLNLLTTEGHIRWKINKTNQDYLAELRTSRFREEFTDLTRSYEYVWYGDYDINEQGFDAMEKIFRTFQQKVSLKA